jgi:hypothetical protein
VFAFAFAGLGRLWWVDLSVTLGSLATAAGIVAAL